MQNVLRTKTRTTMKCNCLKTFFCNQDKTLSFSSNFSISLILLFFWPFYQNRQRPANCNYGLFHGFAFERDISLNKKWQKDDMIKNRAVPLLLCSINNVLSWPWFSTIWISQSFFQPSFAKHSHMFIL